MTRLQEQGFSILFIVPSDYISLQDKGVASLILERDEGGFFKKVMTVHPSASRTQDIDLNETHRLIEFGPDYPCSVLNFSGAVFVRRLLKSAAMIRRLVTLVRQNKIDVIRATDPYWCGFYAWAVSRLTGIPFCISIHADYDKCYRLDGRKGGRPFWYKIFERFLLPRAHLIMPISEYLKGLAIQQGAIPEKVRVIPHGIDVNQFIRPPDIDMQREFAIPKNKKILTMVGRLSRQKYVYDALEVARRLKQHRDDFVLIYVGGGEEREALELIVQKEGLSSTVKMIGFQPNPRVSAILHQSTLALCLLAGFSLIEACVAGMPVVCYDIEWHRQVIRNRETGLIIEEGDIDALTEAVLYLLDRPGQAKEMGLQSRQYMIGRHDVAHTSQMKKNCYLGILKSRCL